MPPPPRSRASAAWPIPLACWAGPLHAATGRPGILLYGADPLPDAAHGLRPVMTLQSEVFAVRELQRGDALGYGAHYVADRPQRIGLVAIGYADGYPRTVPSGTPVAVGGHRSHTLGRVSMDMMTVDLSRLPTEGIGSKVELWGRQVAVNEVAAAAGTIGYELLCHVQRVPRVYVEG